MRGIKFLVVSYAYVVAILEERVMPFNISFLFLSLQICELGLCFWVWGWEAGGHSPCLWYD